MILARTVSQVLPVEAKSMYFGGERIVLDDVRLDKFSSDKLGLVCTVCKEPVRRRKGDINVPHFAHFPTIATQKIEECERRRSVHSGRSFPPLDWSLYEGERLELFQKYFLNIIKKSIPELDIHAIDRKSKQDDVYSSVQVKSLNLLRRKQDVFARHIRAVSEESTELEIKIACEALAYILVMSSRPIFMLISKHLILRRKNLSYSTDDPQFPKELCLEISNLLASVDWTESFARLSGFQPVQMLQGKDERKKVKKKQNTISVVRTYKRKSEEIEGSHLFVYLLQEKVFIDKPNSLDDKERELIGFIRTKEMLMHGRQMQKRKEDIRCASSSIRVFRRHYRFALLKDSIEGNFLPFLRDVIRGKLSSKKPIISVKSRFGRLRLSDHLEDFLMSGRTQIMSGNDAIATVTIDTLTESRYADKYLLKNFLIRSDRYNANRRKYPTMQAAVLRLIHKQYKELHTP